MLKRLQQHWGVNSIQVLLILITFALGGSLCGYLGRKLLAFITIDSKVLWTILYIILVTLLWPLCVLLISVPLGQFIFFKKYVGKLINKLRGKSQKAIVKKINIAIFASGEGSNTKKIIDYFTNSLVVNIALVASNNAKAGVLQIARDHHIDTLTINKDEFFKGDSFIATLKKYNIDFIILAGFLWKVPSSLISIYPKKIINIHPALLPKYGGKGMYGQFVHEAVVAANEVESGITIHYVDDIYDHGEVIFQATCVVEATDTPATLASKIQTLEHTHYPTVIASVLPKQR